MTRLDGDGAFIAGYRDLGEIAVEAGEERLIGRLVADTVAIAIAARRAGEGASAHDLRARSPLPPGQSVVWGASETRTRALDAAFLNGTAAEVLDFQEVLLLGRNNGHAAVVIVPALLALLDACPAHAPRLFPALRAAFLCNIALMQALGRGHRKGAIGFRTTSLGAPVAAALGGACLLGLDHAATRHAVGIAACALPAGLLAAMAPSMGSYSADKDLAVGFCAAHAVDAVYLAAAGATAPAAPLTGARGWLASFGFDTAEPEQLARDPDPGGLERYAIKRYATNFGCQAAIRAAIELGDIRDQDIRSVEIRVKSSSAASLSTTDLPNPLAARFSLPYSVASAIRRGRCNLEDYAPEALRDPHVLGLMARCRLVADDDFEARHQREGIFPGEVRVTLADGSTRAVRHDGPWEGLDDAAIDGAFHAKLASLLGAEGAGGMSAAVAGLARGRMPQDAGRVFG